MLFFIFAIIALVIGAVITVLFLVDESKFGAVISAVVTMAICSVFMVLACFRSVPAGHTGVVTVFGKIV